ncbi:MAG: hypothetical protein DI616_07695 [Paracoccus denitrificans]|uniref:Uncharacterized protein n=1 Tax=Paracoccus denitrificans TaxID=266 RepID=A0A533I893_PARDE|nr:MAG: hypothetical protein DI616_07695 [Paracoccus denitrificans]
MTKHTHIDLARASADQMIADRFGHSRGTLTFAAYLDYVDARQTRHLSPAAAALVIAKTGDQRQRIKLTLEGGVIIAHVPLKDTRRHGAYVWAQIGLAEWLDLIENGADGAWFLNYAGKHDKRGYVRTSPPLASQGAATLVTVGRLVAGAGKGRVVRFKDRNPLNLRRGNLFLNGAFAAPDGQRRGAKHDACALMAEGASRRRSLAGSGFDMPHAMPAS